LEEIDAAGSRQVLLADATMPGDGDVGVAALRSGCEGRQGNKGLKDRPTGVDSPTVS
jgi:hypothetical protein